MGRAAWQAALGGSIVGKGAVVGADLKPLSRSDLCWRLAINKVPTRLLLSRRRYNLWLTVTLVGELCDLLLTFVSTDRYSAGWYLARAYSLVTALTVAIMFVVEFSSLFLRFSRLSSVDPLTGLSNRRTFDANLGAGLATCSRQGLPLYLWPSVRRRSAA